jgi:hypothetical protein
MAGTLWKSPRKYWLPLPRTRTPENRYTFRKFWHPSMNRQVYTGRRRLAQMQSFVTRSKPWLSLWRDERVFRWRFGGRGRELRFLTVLGRERKGSRRYSRAIRVSLCYQTTYFWAVPFGGRVGFEGKRPRSVFRSPGWHLRWLAGLQDSSLAIEDILSIGMTDIGIIVSCLRSQ